MVVVWVLPNLGDKKSFEDFNVLVFIVSKLESVLLWNSPILSIKLATLKLQLHKFSFQVFSFKNFSHAHVFALSMFETMYICLAGIVQLMC